MIDISILKIGDRYEAKLKSGRLLKGDLRLVEPLRNSTGHELSFVEVLEDIGDGDLDRVGSHESWLPISTDDIDSIRRLGQ